ncbi:putative imidazoleglycerol-phosphate dehydratase [Candidatus Tremblaya phenacola PAVE]|nr:putative imidazoleglycerol-phosphate dehydratase [Candidatus Tremblaya phenacola PAVE]
MFFISKVGRGGYVITGIPFLDHMLQQVSLNSKINFSICSVGDILIDKHHLVEDVGIMIGFALRKLTNNLNSIIRYGCSHIPLDEALSQVVIDFSGRTEISCQQNTKQKGVGSFSIALLFELLNSISRTAQITIRIETARGRDVHHQLETSFKSLGRSLRTAIQKDSSNCISTKGLL